MKKLYCFWVIATFVILFGCENDETHINKEEVKIISEYIDEYEGYVKKEIIVYDENKLNSIFLRLNSKSEDSIKVFLEKTQLELVLNFENNKTFQKSESFINSNETYALQEPSVHIEFVAENLEPEVVSFSLKISPSLQKSFNPYPIPIASVETTGSFIGVKNESRQIFVKFNSKECWLCSWKDVTYDGANTTEVYPYSYRHMDDDDDLYYKIRLIVYRAIGETEYPTHHIEVDKRKLQRRGTNCMIGEYDGAHCYVGTPPAGTTAFMYPSSHGAFYYTPVNGNQCPMPGSRWDGAHCYVADIPNDYQSEGFIWENHFYVFPYLSLNF